MTSFQSVIEISSCRQHVSPLPMYSRRNGSLPGGKPDKCRGWKKRRPWAPTHGMLLLSNVRLFVPDPRIGFLFCAPRHGRPPDPRPAFYETPSASHRSLSTTVESFCNLFRNDSFPFCHKVQSVRQTLKKTMEEFVPVYILTMAESVIDITSKIVDVFQTQR